MSELLEPIKLRRWTTAEYLKIAETGVFDGEHLELIGGEICQMTPMNEGHAGGLTDLNFFFVRQMPLTLRVRNQMPLYLGESSVPEPDIAIIDAQISRHRERPTTAYLVVEVSDTTLRYDQTEKASLYAAAQIVEYWILNVQNGTIEVYREPVEDSTARFGWVYGLKQIFTRAQTVSPLCAPDVSLQIGEFLP